MLASLGIRPSGSSKFFPSRGRERSDLPFDGLPLLEAVLVQVGGRTARTVFLDGRRRLAQPRVRARVFYFFTF